MKTDFNLNVIKAIDSKEYPRVILYKAGLSVEEYRNLKIECAVGKEKDKVKVAYIDALSDKIQLSLCNIQQLALENKISPAMYKLTVEEFECNGESIKENVQILKSRYEKLKKQKVEYENNGDIKL